MTFELASQLHVYLPLINTHLAKCLNSVCESYSIRRYDEQGEGPSRCLLRDCENFAKVRFQL